MNMSNSYVGQIDLFAAPYAPQGWLPCNGQELNISDYAGLHKVIGNVYGGDGSKTFALPKIEDVDQVKYYINTNQAGGPEDLPGGTIGEITLFPKSQVPAGWISCDGTSLKISDHMDLYQLIGGTFGHNETMFSLPGLPAPNENLEYGICQVGKAPWDGSVTNFSFEGTIAGIQLFPTSSTFHSDTWLICNGQAVSGSLNEQLYSQIGTIWGGTESAFKIPKIEGPAQGINYIICNQGIFPSR